MKKNDLIKKLVKMRDKEWKISEKLDEKLSEGDEHPEFKNGVVCFSHDYLMDKLEIDSRQAYALAYNNVLKMLQIK